VRRFYETLRKLGDLEGDNLVVERYSAEGRTDHLTALAGTIVSRKPDVIVTNWKTENDRPRHSTTCLYAVRLGRADRSVLGAKSCSGHRDGVSDRQALATANYLRWL
jgi:hypothetical protein